MTIKDVTEASFEADVLERSHSVPVVVDFWAEWCAPCRALGPVLEKLARAAGGTWELAKLDVDSNQALASAAGIQGIPAVKAFKDGKLVAEFTGALPEAQVRTWLEQLGPSEADLTLDEAGRLEASDDAEAALVSYRRVLDLEPAHAEARSSVARLELVLRSNGIDEGSLRACLEADPADVEAVASLADALASSDRLEEAFDLLLEAVSSTSDEDRDRVRIHLLGLLDTVPTEDPRAVAARRSLSLALF